MIVRKSCKSFNSFCNANKIKFIILLISMATKLERLDKFSLLPTSRSNHSRNSSQIQQTATINNSKINKPLKNQLSKLSQPICAPSAGNQNLINNLKQLSQTRRQGFLNHIKEKSKSNSPSIIRKAKTQELRAISKIYGHARNTSLKQTQTSFRKNETINHILQPGIKANSSEDYSPLKKIVSRHDKTVRQRFHQGQGNVIVLKNYVKEVLPLKTFRGDRFEIANETTSLVTASNLQKRDSQINSKSPHNHSKVYPKQVINEDQVEFGSKNFELITLRIAPVDSRRRTYSKAIAKIDQVLLTNTDDYFFPIHTQKLPQSKIELLLNSVGHPGHLSKEYCSRDQLGRSYEVYDFNYQQQRKKLPSPIHRKKQSDQQNKK